MNKLYTFFFDEKKYTNLSIVRIMFFFAMIINIPLIFVFKSYITLPESRFNGAGLLQFELTENILRNHIDVIGIALVISYFFSMIGLFSKISKWMAFFTTFVFLSLPISYGSENWLEMPLLYIMFFMALSHSGDHLSIDALLRKNKLPDVSKEYNWPIKMMQIIFIFYFFSSGVHKLIYSGTSWFTTDNLANNFVCRIFFIKQHFPESIINLKLNYYAAKLGYLNRLLAFVVIVFQIMSPLMLIRKFTKYFIIVFIIMHAGIYFTLFVGYKLCIPLYVCWVNWEKCFSFFQSLSLKGQKVKIN